MTARFSSEGHSALRSPIANSSDIIRGGAHPSWHATSLPLALLITSVALLSSHVGKGCRSLDPDLGLGLINGPHPIALRTSIEGVFSLVANGKPCGLWEDRCRPHIPSHFCKRLSVAVCWQPMDWWSAYPASLSASDGLSAV